MKEKLLVIIPDKLSVLINKGEVVPRYYNPGNVFDEVHIMMTNDDKPDPDLVKSMVGDAELFLYNFPPPPHFFRNTFGWQPFLMKKWLYESSDIVRKINPSIVRCYGMHLNLSIGSYCKDKFNIPLLVSMHTHPLLDSHKEELSIKEKIIKKYSIKFSRYLKNANLILPVYIGIENFLNDKGLSNYKTLYNSVRIDESMCKKDFKISNIFKIVCVGQQIYNKNPENIIKAISKLEGVSLDIIGTGKLNSYLKKLVNDLKVEKKVKFIDSIRNDELCQKLITYDCFSASIDCIGISKTLIESFLLKLPVLINKNSHTEVPELNDSICLRVKDTEEGYINGINKFINDKKLRINLAENAYKTAWEKWSPQECEKKHINVYREFLND